QIGGDGLGQSTHAEIFSHDFGAGDARELKERIDELTHALHTAANPADVVSACVVDAGGEVFLESKAESINRTERCSQIVRNRVAEGLELTVDALQLRSPHAYSIFKRCIQR